MGRQLRHLFEQAGAPMTLRLDRHKDYEQLVDGAQLTDTLTDLSRDLPQGDLLLPHEALDALRRPEDDLRQGRGARRHTALIRALPDTARQWLDQPALTRGMHPGPATMLSTAACLSRPPACRRNGRARTAATCRRARLSPPARASWPQPAASRLRLAPDAPTDTHRDRADPPMTPSDPSPAADSSALRRPPTAPGVARPAGARRRPDAPHVAVIMDGNGRWANQRGLPRREGHNAGGPPPSRWSTARWR